MVGLDVDCCAMAEVVGVRWLGGHWGPLTGTNHGLPKNTDLAAQFELAAVAGDPAVSLMTSGTTMPEVDNADERDQNRVLAHVVF